MYGVQYGHECWCGDHMDFDQYGAGKCDYRCAGDMHTTCGGCEYFATDIYVAHSCMHVRSVLCGCGAAAVKFLVT